jgi:hypothetical protein
MIPLTSTPTSSTCSRRWPLYSDMPSAPYSENHQNTRGATLRPRFSDASHWIRKREKNAACPDQPMISQTVIGRPDPGPSGSCSKRAPPSRRER